MTGAPRSDIPDDVDAGDVRLFAWGWLQAWATARADATVTGAQVLDAMAQAQQAGVTDQRKRHRARALSDVRRTGGGAP